MGENTKKEINQFFVIGFIILLIVVFMSGMYLSYEKGTFDGMTRFCDKDIGFDNLNQKYVCYDKAEYDSQNNKNNQYNNFELIGEIDGT